METFGHTSGGRRTRWTSMALSALVSGVLVTLVSCSTDDSSTTPASAEAATVTDSAQGADVTATDSSAIDPGLQPYIDLAVADLAARLQRDAGDITTRSAVLMVWPDASLGCPTPGMQYAQVQTDGAKIVLEVDGTAYAYHAGGDTTPFLCEPKKGPASTTTAGG